MRLGKVMRLNRLNELNRLDDSIDPIDSMDSIDSIDPMAGKVIKGARVLVVGLAFKANVQDACNTRVLELIDELTQQGLDVAVSGLCSPVVPDRRNDTTNAIDAMNVARNERN